MLPELHKMTRLMPMFLPLPLLNALGCANITSQNWLLKESIALYFIKFLAWLIFLNYNYSLRLNIELLKYLWEKHTTQTFVPQKQHITVYIKSQPSLTNLVLNLTTFRKHTFSIMCNSDYIWYTGEIRCCCLGNNTCL